MLAHSLFVHRDPKCSPSAAEIAGAQRSGVLLSGKPGG
jgi:hypothetical protein